MIPVAVAFLIGSGACLLAAGPATSQSRPPAQGRSVLQRMPCAEAMAWVKRDGAVVLPGSANPAERLVRDRSFCDASEVAELRFLPTRDNPQCPIGYRCRDTGFEDWTWD